MFYFTDEKKVSEKEVGYKNRLDIRTQNLKGIVFEKSNIFLSFRV